MGDGSSGRSRVNLQPCCEERLEKLRDVQGLGEITESLVATSPFLGVFGSGPIDAHFFLKETDWELWQRAVTSARTLNRGYCRKVTEQGWLHHSSGPGGVRRFWRRLHRSFDPSLRTRARASRPFARRFTSRFVGTLSTDEQGMAEALFQEAGTDAQKLYAVFDHLADTSPGDADDVARAYLDLVREKGREEMKTIRADPMLADLLADLLEAGWTTESEAEHVRYLEYLKSVSRR